MKVTAAFAKAHLPDLLKAVENGEIVTISRYNVPIADLVPSNINKKLLPKFGTGKGKVQILDPNWDKAIETDRELEAFIDGKS